MTDDDEKRSEYALEMDDRSQDDGGDECDQVGK